MSTDALHADECVFTTSHGNPWRYPDFHSDRWVSARAEAERGGLPKHVTPHLQRHTTVVWSLAVGVRIEVVLEQLGHASLHERYADVVVGTRRVCFACGGPVVTDANHGKKIADMSEPDFEAQVRAATAALAGWVETIAERLENRFVCEVREATTEELQRPAHGDRMFADPTPGLSFAVQPRSPQAATLVVVRHEFFTGTGVTLKFGKVGYERVPCCDECAVLPPSDSDVDDFVQQAESAMWAATRGFAEFRWEKEDTSGSGTAFEEGWFYSDGGSTWCPASPGPPFQQIWRPWARR